METIKILKVERERFSEIHLTRNEVLEKKEDQAMRWHELQRAMSLGNLHKVPSKIRFCGEDGQVYETEETLWAVIEKYVVFKNSVMLPIHAILEVIV